MKDHVNRTGSDKRDGNGDSLRRGGDLYVYLAHPGHATEYAVENAEDNTEQPAAASVPRELFATPGRALALTFVLGLLLVVAAAVVWLSSSSAPSAAAPGQATDGATAGRATGGSPEVAPRAGALAPDFELVDVRTGQPVRLSGLRGKPVFINFWGTWCPPCRAEMPEMERLARKYGDQTTILGVSMAPRDTPDLVREFVDKYNYSWTFIHDADYGVASTYQVMSIPSSYFIDAQGTVRAVHVGAMNYQQMERYFEQVK
jgi:thiol-disulfide isomerase/thioredoxin